MNYLREIGWKNWLFYASVLGLYIFFAFYFGFVPGCSLPSLGINVSMQGGIGNFSNMITDSCWYPFGLLNFEGYGFLFIGEVFVFLVSDIKIALSLTYLFVFLISYVSTLFLGLKLLKNKVLTFFFIIVFYLNPYFNQHMSIPAVGCGALLISLSLILDYWLYISVERMKDSWDKKRRGLFFLAQFLGRILIVSFGWYTAIISAVFSCLSLLIYMVMRIIQKRKWKESLYYLIYVVMPWFVAMAIILVLTPRGTSSLSSGLEFLNGSSVDIMTLFFPGKMNLWVSRILPSIEEMIPEGNMLYGDATMWDNYLGYILIVCAVVGVILIKKKKEKIALLLTGIVGLILSLGPAVKCCTYHDIGRYVYNLPFENQIVFFWKDLFGIFPLSMMRAVYRWMLIPRIALILLAFLGLRELWNRKKALRALAVVLCLGAIIEYYPASGVPYMIRERMKWNDQLEQFDDDVVNPLAKYVDEGDLLALCSYTNSTNAYVAPYMMERLGTKTYAGAGDKSREMAWDYIPTDIVKLQTSGNCDEMVYYINEVLSKKLCDAVVLPFFNMREDSYKWAPAQEDVERYREFAGNVAEELDGKFEIAMEDYFMIIMPKDDSDRAYEMIADEELGGETKRGSTWLFSTQKDLYLYNGSEDFKQKIAVGDDDSALYVAAWWRAVNEESTVKCTYTFFDDEDQQIGEKMLEIPITGEYSKYELDIPFDEAASYAIVCFQSEGGAYIRNVWLEPYEMNVESVVEGEWIEIDTDAAEEKNLQAGTDSGQFNVAPYEIKRLALEFEVKPEALADCTLVSKMNYWANNMTFSCFLKEGSLAIFFSQDGSEGWGIFADAGELHLGEWNKVEVLYEDGVGSIAVNGVVLEEAEIWYETLYSSAECIEVAKDDFSGEIRNVKLKYN